MSESGLRLDPKFRQISKEFSFNVITRAIQLEEIMTTIICLELSKNWMKIDPYMDYFDNFGFDSKIKLSEIILKTNHPEILKKYPKIFASVREMKDLRNKLAHLNRYFETDSEDKYTEFVLHHKKIEKQIKFTEKQMLQYDGKMRKWVGDMRRILHLIGNDFGIERIWDLRNVRIENQVKN